MVSVSESGVYTECIQPVSKMDTQVRLGKDRLELGKDSNYFVGQDPTLPPPLPDEEPSEKSKIPYEEIVEYLNRNAGTHYRHTAEKTRSMIRSRFKEGFTLDDFKTVIEAKCKEWSQDKHMEQYLRPETLFGTKFDRYLNEARKEAERNGKDNGDSKPRYGVYL